MAFEYIKDVTTVDDIIEHILMRLNTDFEGGCLQVPDFCYIEEKHYYDPTMEMLVRDKMYKHGVAKRCQGRGQSEKAIALTPKGVEVFRRGGWKKYLNENQNSKSEVKNQDLPLRHLSRFQKTANQYPKVEQRSEYKIKPKLIKQQLKGGWKWFREFSDHEVIGNIVNWLLAFLCLYILSQFPSIKSFINRITE